jgi:RNA polymerase sigma-70 factor, ECF subfamily
VGSRNFNAGLTYRYMRRKKGAPLQQVERIWLRRAIHGDARAFSKIVEMYSKPVYNLCYRMLGNAEDAEDAAQETFVRAFRAIKRYDTERKFATWLLSIASNYCIDQYRRLRPVLVPIDDAPMDFLAEGNPGPERSMIEREASDDVQVLLSKLDPRDRAAVMLYYWYEYSYKEISQVLKLSESALKSRLHRARKTLVREWQNKELSTTILAGRSRERATVQ